MSVFCQHGTYIGDPGGPDHMCGWCEDGVSVQEAKRIEMAWRVREGVKQAASFDHMVAVVSQFPWNPGVAQAMMEVANDGSVTRYARLAYEAGAL